MANVARLMAAELPKDAKISRDAKVLMQEMVTEFICFITAEANDFSVAEGKKAITLDDQLAAFDSLDLACYLPVLEAAAKVLPNYKSGRAHDVDYAANSPAHQYQKQHLPQHPLERSMTASTHSVLSMSTGSHGYLSSESMFASTDDGLSDASWNSSNDVTRLASPTDSTNNLLNINMHNMSEATARIPRRVAAKPVVAKPVMPMQAHPVYSFDSTMQPMPVCAPTPMIAPRVHPVQHVPPPIMALPHEMFHEFPAGYLQPPQHLSAPMPAQDQFRRNQKVWNPPHPF